MQYYNKPVFQPVVCFSVKPVFSVFSSSPYNEYRFACTFCHGNLPSVIKAQYKTFIELYFVVFSKIQIKIFATRRKGKGFWWRNQLFPVCLVFSLAVLLPKYINTKLYKIRNYKMYSVHWVDSKLYNLFPGILTNSRHK